MGALYKKNGCSNVHIKNDKFVFIVLKCLFMPPIETIKFSIILPRSLYVYAILKLW